MLVTLVIRPLGVSSVRPNDAYVIAVVVSMIAVILVLVMNSPVMGRLPTICAPLLVFIMYTTCSPLSFSKGVVLNRIKGRAFNITLNLTFCLIKKL